MTQTTGNKVIWKMPDGFSLDGLKEDWYCLPLAEAFKPIGEQNETFIRNMDRPDFNPAVALESNHNGAAKLIRAAFEVIADYEQGRVPWLAVEHVTKSTDDLIRKLKGRKNAPKAELEAVMMAFGAARSIWATTSPRPMAPRACYIKSLMKARDRIFEKLDALHLAYDAASYDKPKRKCASRCTDEGRFAKLDRYDRKSVCEKINTLVSGGTSVNRAIERLFREPGWRVKMVGRSAATWRVYYQDWKKAHAYLPEPRTTSHEIPPHSSGNLI